MRFGPLRDILVRFHAFWAAARFPYEILCFLALMRVHALWLSNVIFDGVMKGRCRDGC